MKKLITLLLAVAMVLSMAACGGSAPAETAPAATEPVVQATAAPTEEPTEEPTVAPTEDPYAYTVYTLGESESYEDAVWRHDFWEVDMNACVEEAASYGTKGGQATPLSLELSQVGFRMEVDYTGYDYITSKVIPFGTVELIGAKADQIGDISGIDPKDYQYTGSSYTIDENGVKSDYFAYADGYGQTDLYWYYNVDEAGNDCDFVCVAATYYTFTDNLYNIIYRVPNGVEERGEPCLTTRITSDKHYSPFYPTVQTLTYGDFTFEISQFAIICGDERYVYDYRPGMSFSDWACSELNVDGWIPWYGDAVLSPDRAYVINLGYLDMRDFMDNDWVGSPVNTLIAEEYDGKINRLNNNYTTAEISGADLGSFGEGATVISGDALQQFLEQNGMAGMSFEELQSAINGKNTSDFNMAGITQTDAADFSFEETEAEEISKLGNISVPVAHMVNAKTPLFTPGFRVVSKEDGRIAYHSVEMGNDLYLLDDTLDIYMNGIADELIPHIKLYAFPESEEFMATLEGHTILNAHPTPLEQGSPMLTIPEDAVCLTFQRVADGEEAPNSPSILKVPKDKMHGSLNKDAVYARYVTKDDPNFGEGVNLVFAITFDDELVYWIHMGANFNETVEVTRVSYDMPY